MPCNRRPAYKHRLRHTFEVSEHSPMIEAIIGLIGVVLGFGLSTGYQELKDRRQRKNHKGAVMEELRANLHMIPQKRQTISNMINELQQGQMLPGPAVHFSRVFFENCFPSVASSLTVTERNSFHLLYEYFRVVDWLLDTYADRILEVTATEEVHNRIQVALAMLGDLKNLLAIIEDLAQMHLSGKPKDVFRSEEDYLKLTQARYN